MTSLVAVENHSISAAMLHPRAVAAVPHPRAVRCSHSVTRCSNSARALVAEPNVSVNQGFRGSPTTVLPAAPSFA